MKLVASMEEIDKELPNEAQDFVSENSLELLKAEGELQDKSADIKALQTAIESASDDHSTLNRFSGLLNSRTVDKNTVKIADIAIESICDRLGLSRHENIISMESYHQTGTVALENLGSAIARVFKAIKDAVINFLKKIRDFIYKLFGIRKNREQELKDVKERLEKVSKEEAERVKRNIDEFIKAIDKAIEEEKARNKAKVEEASRKFSETKAGYEKEYAEFANDSNNSGNNKTVSNSKSKLTPAERAAKVDAIRKANAASAAKYQKTIPVLLLELKNESFEDENFGRLFGYHGDITESVIRDHIDKSHSIVMEMSKLQIVIQRHIFYIIDHLQKIPMLSDSDIENFFNKVIDEDKNVAAEVNHLFSRDGESKMQKKSDVLIGGLCLVTTVSPEGNISFTEERVPVKSNKVVGFGLTSQDSEIGLLTQLEKFMASTKNVIDLVAKNEEIVKNRLNTLDTLVSNVLNRIKDDDSKDQRIKLIKDLADDIKSMIKFLMSLMFQIPSICNKTEQSILAFIKDTEHRRKIAMSATKDL